MGIDMGLTMSLLVYSAMELSIPVSITVLIGRVNWIQK
jgi:hypothetical protein